MELTASDIAIIANTPLFAGLDAHCVRGACESAVLREYAAGATLVHEGEAYDGLCILLSGKARVGKSASGAEVLMSVLGPGAMLGAQCLFTQGEPAVTHVRALAPCRGAYFPEEGLRALMRGDFALAENYMRYLTGRIRFLTGRIESIGSPGAAQKLWNYIVSSAHDGAADLSMGYTALAAALCMSRASLYRALDELEGRGAIRRGGRTIYIIENLTEEI